jgi:hypothetical protein
LNCNIGSPERPAMVAVSTVFKTAPSASSETIAPVDAAGVIGLSRSWS